VGDGGHVRTNALPAPCARRGAGAASGWGNRLRPWPG